MRINFIIFIVCISLSGFNCFAKKTPFEEEIKNASKAYGVKTSIIKGIIRQESNFNPRAKSHVGAKGLMQLMPFTAKEVGVKDIWNPQQNIYGGTKYIGKKLREFQGDLCRALAAYNWGAGNVRKLQKRTGSTNCKTLIPFMPGETKNYIVKVIKYSKEYGWDGKIDSNEIAKAAGASIDANEDGRVHKDKRTSFGIYEKLFKRMSIKLAEINKSTFVSVANELIPVLNVLLLLWIFVNLLKIYRKNSNLKDLSYDTVMVIFILAIAINYRDFEIFVFNPISRLSDYYINIFFPGAEDLGESLDMFVARMSIALAYLLQDSDGIASSLLIEFLFILFNWVTSLFAGMLALSNIGLFIVTFLAPLFLVSAIFDTTKPLMKRWLQMFLFFAVLKLLISIVMYFMYGIGLNNISSFAYDDLGDYVLPLILLIICWQFLIESARLSVALVGGRDIILPGLLGSSILKNLRKVRNKQISRQRKHS